MAVNSDKDDMMSRRKYHYDFNYWNEWATASVVLHDEEETLTFAIKFLGSVHGQVPEN